MAGLYVKRTTPSQTTSLTVPVSGGWRVSVIMRYLLIAIALTFGGWGLSALCFHELSRENVNAFADTPLHQDFAVCFSDERETINPPLSFRVSDSGNSQTSLRVEEESSQALDGEMPKHVFKGYVSLRSIVLMHSRLTPQMLIGIYCRCLSDSTYSLLDRTERLLLYNLETLRCVLLSVRKLSSTDLTH